MNNSQRRSGGVGDGPQNGSFPLDRMHECDEKIKAYFDCLSNNNNFAAECRQETRDYLDCRKQKGLMSEKDFQDAKVPHPNAPKADFDAWKERQKLNNQKKT